MLRLKTDSGWWMITHQDHARLAGAFAAAWGNDTFRSPHPRHRILYAISSHDDGWCARDAHPSITRQGIPSAFSSELVGKYSAFEEIDLADYLGVRERAVHLIAERDAYAALLISMHTCNLLTERADRATINAEGLLLMDAFLERQIAMQKRLQEEIAADAGLTLEEKDAGIIQDHFRLLQACDNLSLLSCVAFARPADLLHPLPLRDGGTARVSVEPTGTRSFKLSPWPFGQERAAFDFPARHIEGHVFASSQQIEEAFQAAPVETLTVNLMA